MPPSSPAHAPESSTPFALNAFGTLSQAAATDGEGLGDGASEELPDAAVLACPLTDGAML
jgi:hypothetical protein